MVSLRINITLALAAISLVACGSSDNTTTSQNLDDGSVQLYGAKVATNVSSLPTCDSTQIGQLFFVLADEEFKFCSTKGYQAIDLRGVDGNDGATGAKGEKGDTGSVGKTGTAGDDGEDGSSCSVISNTNGSKTILCEDGTTATVNDGASCVVTDNNDNSYDLTCSGTTVTVRDGADGAKGDDGVSCQASKSNDSLFLDCNGVLDTIVDGANGSSCTVTDDNAGTLTQTCTNGTSVSWPKAVCGTQAYEPATHFCDAGTVVELCGGSTYSTATHFCEAGTVLELCGGSTYSPATHFCDAGTVLELCGGSTYSAATHFCDAGTSAPMLAWSTHCLVPGNCGTFTDIRETPAKKYKWTKIGTQTWMAENLAYLPFVNATSGASTSVANYYVYNYPGSSVADAKASSHYTTYGVLYNWTAANSACPTGWHLPSSAEWATLETYVGGASTASTKLKSVSGWTAGGDTETDAYAFSALPGGGYTGAGFSSTLYGNWWTATEDYATFAYYRIMDNYDADVGSGSSTKWSGFSVRCLQD